MQQGVEVAELKFNCSGCGASVEYEPGTLNMKCPFCSKEQPIPIPQRPIVEHAFNELDPVPHATAEGFGTAARFFKCDKCGATSALPGTQMTSKCAFCDSPIVVEVPPIPGMVAPESLVPFAIDKARGGTLFKDWISGLWFRPSDLKQRAMLSQINGAYAPHFTFDSNAYSRWTGYAGHYYYVTESYTAVVNGKSVRQTRQVQKIRWEYRSGTHGAFYDDELVVASTGIVKERIGRIYPYNLAGLVPYSPEFLAGFGAEAYSVDPRACWDVARGRMQESERKSCSALLDGDTQRDLVVQSEFSDIKWKHLLLPLYIASYRYGDKVFAFMVNGQTGKIDGDAPYSWAKIGAVVAGVAIGVAVVVAKLVGWF